MAYYLPTSTEENMIERACKYIGVSVGDFDLCHWGRVLGYKD